MEHNALALLALNLLVGSIAWDVKDALALLALNLLVGSIAWCVKGMKANAFSRLVCERYEGKCIQPLGLAAHNGHLVWQNTEMKHFSSEVTQTGRYL